MNQILHGCGSGQLCECGHHYSTPTPTPLNLRNLATLSPSAGGGDAAAATIDGRLRYESAAGDADAGPLAAASSAGEPPS